MGNQHGAGLRLRKGALLTRIIARSGKCTRDESRLARYALRMRISSTPSEVYVEFTAIGSVQKCTAIDGRTGVEVSVMGPITAARHDMERLALAKLKRRLEQGAK